MNRNGILSPQKQRLCTSAKIWLYVGIIKRFDI